MNHRHYILHKPYGYLSQFKNNKRRKKKLLDELYDFAEGTMAIGRLDVKSEGLLLLSTDGKLSQLIRSQKYEKEYYVQVDGIPSAETLKTLAAGPIIRIDGKDFQCKSCLVKQIQAPQNLLVEERKERGERHGKMSWLSITLREGKFHQVRKMVAAVGHPCQRLIRYRIGEEKLDGIPFGKVREVEQFQLA